MRHSKTVTQGNGTVKKITKTTVAIDTELLARAKAAATRIEGGTVQKLIADGLVMRLAQLEAGN